MAEVVSKVTYDQPGDYDFVVPPGVEAITLKATGAGAHVSTSSTGRHAGSGGGAYSQANNVPVTPGETLTIHVRASLSNTTESAHLAMASRVERGETMLVFAEGGRSGVTAGEAGGRAANGVGDITFSGGAGGNRGTTAGGGGGGAATADGDGQNGTGGSGATPGVGGLDGSNNASGGDGGAPEEVGNAGAAPGGGTGGKGASSEAQQSPPGGAGQVVIEMVLPDVVAQDGLPETMFSALNNERVAYAFVGDSNVLFGGTTGHYQGIEKALHQRFGIHGFGLRPAGRPVGGMGSFFNGVRARNLDGDDVLNGTDESLPAELRAHELLSLPSVFAGVLDGDTVSVTAGQQLDVQPTSLIGVTAAMRFYMQLGVWKNEDATSGNPKVRLNVAEGATTIDQTVLDPGDTLDDDYGATVVSVDIPANASRSNDLRVRYWDHGVGASQLTGPVFPMFLWGELLDITSGPLVHVAGYHGGKGIRRSMQENFELTAGVAYENYFSLVKSTLLAPNPKLIIHISHGGNDRSDNNPSWGGSAWNSPYAGNTAVGFRNNLERMMDWLTEKAEAAGFDADDIYFIASYHPQPGGDRLQMLADFEGGAASLAADRKLAVVRGTAITSPEEMVANGWYNSFDGEEGDHAHLSQAGYEGYNALLLESLFGPQGESPESPRVWADGVIHPDVIHPDAIHPDVWKGGVP